MGYLNLNEGIRETESLSDPLIFSEKSIVKTKHSAPTYNANNVNAQAALNQKMRALQNAEREAVRVQEFSDGKIRYYEKETPSRNSRTTRGGAYVTEYNPRTGQVRSWYECRDYEGNVNRIHPKTIDGQQIKGQHYPPTRAELEKWSPKQKGTK